MVHSDIDVYPEFPLGQDTASEPPTDYRIELIFGDFNQFEINKTQIIYTPIHDTIVPKSWIDKLNDSRLVFFGSSAAKKSLKGQGVTVPIYVWFPGVDDYFQYIDRDFDDLVFNFLHVNAIHERKGTDKLCESFEIAFPYEQNVRLILQSPAETELATKLKNRFGYDKRIIFGLERVLHSEMSTVYKKGHCFIYPSIKEGCGLTITEAMATGLPVISTQTSSMLDVMSEDRGWWVGCDGIQWVDIGGLADRMRYAYAHRGECREKGLNASRYIENNLTWEKSIEKIYPILKDLYEESYNSNR